MFQRFPPKGMIFNIMQKTAVFLTVITNTKCITIRENHNLLVKTMANRTLDFFRVLLIHLSVTGFLKWQGTL